MALLDTTENLLTFLECCDTREPPKGALAKYATKLAQLDGCIPWDHSGTSELCGVEAGLDGSFNYNGDEFLAAPAVWPLDVASIYSDAMAPEQFIAARLRSISTKEARAMGATLFSPYMAIQETAVLRPDGTAATGKVPIVQLGKRWREASPYLRVTYNNLSDNAFAMVRVAEALHKTWSVWLGFGGGPRLRFTTDPAGASAAFRLRDLPEGRSRRAALQHWVEGHWRAKRVDPSDSAWVRDHLRGTTDFTWNGLRCRIQPPTREREAVAAEQRLRAGGAATVRRWK